MREIDVNEIISVVEKLFVDATYNLSQNVLDMLKRRQKKKILLLAKM